MPAHLIRPRKEHRDAYERVYPYSKIIQVPKTGRKREFREIRCSIHLYFCFTHGKHTKVGLNEEACARDREYHGYSAVVSNAKERTTEEKMDARYRKERQNLWGN